MMHLESLDIVHCDLQPLNIFLRINDLSVSMLVWEVILGGFDSAE
jgi:hypothetical protein